MIDRNPALRRFAGIAARSGVAGSAVMMATTSWAMWSPDLSGAASTPKRGEARIVTPDDSRDPNGGALLTGGGAATAFSFQLPLGAACEGDSATAAYRIQSYMVTDATDPGTLQFASNGPTPSGTGADFRQALFDAGSTASYVNAQTAKADTPGGPGLILAIPAFNFAVFSPGDIVPGTYNIGLACTLGPASATQLKKYWNAQMTFEADLADSAGIKWTAVPSKSPNTLPAGVASAAVSPAPTTTARTTVPSESRPSTEVTPTEATPLSGASVPAPPELPAARPQSSTAKKGNLTAGEGKGGGEPTFTPMLELLTQAPRTDTSTRSLLGWGLFLILLARMAVLLGRPTVSRKTAIR